ncbi:aldose 1-epimerase [Enterobacteriaceae bacterium YMB-R22]|jgi:aldose 1-epimerase|uniref:aldose epimerase family protein n=1 Tax=Tenebrionicola larvae TaxID=2815733 RepID=UPI002012527F|nr:aldose 1-epimerase [Tenebrionicola larvae]MBV4412829.1 aldose 1-epimerase [Tenebrionicola larvae]
MDTHICNDRYNAIRQAFDTPWPGPLASGVVLENACLKVVIHPEDGCRITSLTAFGQELLRQWHPARRAFQYGSFPMIPWVGRMAGATLMFNDKRYAMPANKPPFAMHGMACFAPWRLSERSQTHAQFDFQLDTPWPWRGRVSQRFSLEADALALSLTVETDEKAFPAAAGWHPWFKKWCGPLDKGKPEESLQLSFSADWQERTGADELPDGKRIPPQPGPWDDTFGFRDSLAVTLTWPGKIQLTMTSSGNTLVLFDKQPDAACVEPLSGPPNGINTAPTLVSKGTPLTLTTRWQVEKL